MSSERSEKFMRKITKFEIQGEAIFALCDDGTLWKYSSYNWDRIDHPADYQDEEPTKIVEDDSITVFDLLKIHDIKYSYDKSISLCGRQHELTITVLEKELHKLDKIFRLKRDK